MLDIIREGLLQIQPGMVIWTLITFGLMVFVLWKYVWRVILHALEARSARIASDLEHIRQEKEVADGLLEQRKKMLLKAKEESLSIVNRTKASTVEIKNNILTEAKKEAEKLLQKAQRDIEQLRHKALEEFKAELVNITFEMSRKFLLKKIDPREGERLMDKYLEEYLKNVKGN
jgi:F-type H+-transporting ATPase subunit b